MILIFISSISCISKNNTLHILVTMMIGLMPIEKKNPGNSIQKEINVLKCVEFTHVLNSKINIVDKNGKEIFKSLMISIRNEG